MRITNVFAAGTMLAGIALIAAPTPASAAICPNIGASAGACDLVFTFNADGSITTTGAGGSSIGGEDAIIGVVNNTAATITSFVLDGGSSGIYGFEGDGIDAYDVASAPVAGNPDMTTYGGPRGFFTNISGNVGTVNFVGGIASGGTDYFSLEEAVSLTAPPTVTGPPTTTGGTTSVPEPATMALLSAGLLGLGMVRRRQRG